MKAMLSQVLDVSVPGLLSINTVVVKREVLKPNAACDYLLTLWYEKYKLDLLMMEVVWLLLFTIHM